MYKYHALNPIADIGSDKFTKIIQKQKLEEADAMHFW